MVIERSGGQVPTTFLDARATAAVGHVVATSATRPVEADTVFEVLAALQRLIGCDLVAFNGHDTPGRRMYHSQVVASGERELASLEELAARDQDDPFWQWYWRCEPCSLPDRVGAPVVVALSDFYTAREWAQHPMFIEALGLDGPLSDELLASYPDAPGRTRRVLFLRHDGTRFDERARFLTTLLMPHIGSLLAEAIAPQPQEDDSLTDRQREVLRLVRLGMANKEVAQALQISTGTVRKHLESAYDRLGVQSRTAAVRAATLDDYPQRISVAG